MSLFSSKNKSVNKKKAAADTQAADKKNVKKDVKSVAQSDKSASVKQAGPKQLTKGSLSYRVLMHPLMTEKINLQNAVNQYSFMVSERANKIEIKQAILETYGIKPLKVRIINVRGKAVSSGRGRSVYQKNWKKAIVTLPAGKKIDIYEGV